MAARPARLVTATQFDGTKCWIRGGRWRAMLEERRYSAREKSRRAHNILLGGRGAQARIRRLGRFGKVT